MLYLHTRLRAYVPTMIGLGVLILMGDGIVVFLRILGVEKWTAFYLAVLMGSIGVSMAFRRLHWRTGQVAQEVEDKTITGETR